MTTHTFYAAVAGWCLFGFFYIAVDIKNAFIRGTETAEVIHKHLADLKRVDKRPAVVVRIVIQFALVILLLLLIAPLLFLHTEVVKPFASAVFLKTFAVHYPPLDIDPYTYTDTDTGADIATGAFLLHTNALEMYDNVPHAVPGPKVRVFRNPADFANRPAEVVDSYDSNVYSVGDKVRIIYVEKLELCCVTPLEETGDDKTYSSEPKAGLEHA